MIDKRIVLALCLTFLVTCSNKDRLQEPLEFANPAEFYHILGELEQRLKAQDYQNLTDAIGYLKTVDTEHLSVDSFYQSLSGLSIKQIIEKSQNLKSHAL